MLSKNENSDDLRSEDLEEALTHAERMLASHDRATREARMLQLAQAGTILAAFLVAVVVATFGLSVSGGDTTLVIAFAIVPIIVAAGMTVRCQQLLRSVRRQRARDTYGLVELSGLVRELLPVVANTQQWSDVRHRTMRARLARFPI